ncbi:MAG: 4-hydroxythreonine-4-phosphate dehydrogenase [Alphaproteobacteria bacterium]|jgi:4-hydroxythreonine-4-phosphate dehydrogenase
MSDNTKPKTIAITMGEPAGIGIEIITKALDNPQFKAVNFIIIGDQKLFPDVLPQNVTFHHIDFGKTVQLGICKTDYAAQILDTINVGVHYCLNGTAHALVTAPINKDNIHTINPHFFGHTEYIADIIQQTTGIYHQPVMMLSCPDLKAVPLTIHVPFKKVPEILTTNLIIQHVKIIHHSLQTYYHIQNPRIYIAGLNPHAGDNGIMGDEETTILMPAIEQLRLENINISNPLSADTMFHAAARKNYDIAVCMYHDQALIPVKTLGFDVGVNVTLGLPIMRTSPDHGTALNIAGKNHANPSAMIAAIQEAIILSDVS